MPCELFYPLFLQPSTACVQACIISHLDYCNKPELTPTIGWLLAFFPTPPQLYSHNASSVLKPEWLAVLVCLTCYNRISETEWLINNKFLSHGPGSWESESRVPACWVLLKALFRLQTADFSHCFLQVMKMGSAFLWDLFYKDTNLSCLLLASHGLHLLLPTTLGITFFNVWILHDKHSDNMHHCIKTKTS